MSQKTIILNYLKSGHVIDPLTALRKFGVMRLASRILELREQGYRIFARKKTVKNRHGENCNVCAYQLMNKGELENE